MEDTLKRWQSEKGAAYLSSAVAANETDPARAKLFGDMAASAVFVILITGFIVVGAALFVEVVYQPPYWLHAVLWGAAALIVPLILLRSFKGVLIALQFRNKAAESKFASGE